MDKKCLYLIDAMAFCYRAYYALKNLSTSFGQPTNAVYGFTNMLKRILKNAKPKFMAICFDVSRDTYRQKKFSEYKIQRPPMPEGLSSQMPLIKQIISSYGIAMVEKEGCEADDLIATLAKRATKAGFIVRIVTADKDLLQLVAENITVLSPHKDEDVLYDRQRVRERFSVGPENIPDVMALMGDNVDNIPGVPGIGEKTAVGLIAQFGSLKNLLQRINEISPDKLKQVVAENLQRIKLNMELVLLNDGLELNLTPKELKIKDADYKELYRIFKYLEFNKLLQDLPLPKEKIQDIHLLKARDAQVPDLLGSAEELLVYGQDSKEMVFCAKDVLFSLEEIGGNMRAILEDAKIKKIGHDLKKIKISLGRENINLNGLYFDTMLAGYLLDPSKSRYAISDMAWDYLGRITEDKSLDSSGAIELIAKFKPKLEAALRQRALLGLFNDIEMPLVEVLAEMESTGIRVDKGILENLSQDLQKRLAELIAQIYQMSGCQFNINSPKQLRTVLFERLKLPVLKRGKTGPSTDETVLKGLCTQHKLPATLLEYRQLTKLKSTYIDALPGLVDQNTGRIHASFNQTATETGRLSSSSPNLQNIPVKTDMGQQIRKAIIAFDARSYLLSCDYSQIELRILAHISGDKNLILSFQEGKDIHNATASLIYGLNEREVNLAMRETAKRVNFGIIYGLTPYGLSADLGISVEAAQNFIDAYFLRYPGVKAYIQQQIQKSERDGFVTTILGRRRYIPEINSKNQGIRQFAQRKAINTPIQGSASDLIKLAMVQIYQQIKTKSLQGQMIMQIHDELVFNVPEQELNDFVDLVKDKMENVLKLKVPLRVSTKKGRDWLEMEDIL